jgi:hypothetical protein
VTTAAEAAIRKVENFILRDLRRKLVFVVVVGE